MIDAKIFISSTKAYDSIINLTIVIKLALLFGVRFVKRANLIVCSHFLDDRMLFW